MSVAVKPPLAARFTQPDGWQFHDQLDVRAGQYIRYGWAVPEAPRASVVILPGLSEYCEKYFEVAHDLLRRRFAVACIDWRGQGMSWRGENRDKRCHDDFAADVEDTRLYLDQVPLPHHLPRIMLAHSMGGHIGLRVLNERPDDFACAVMTAPMCGLAVPEWLAGGVADFMAATGRPHGYMPGHAAWNTAKMEAGLRLLTSDPDRRAMQEFWMTQRPDLRMGGLTASWVRAALASIRQVRRQPFLDGVTTPVLVASAGREMVVSNKAIADIVSRLPNAELLEIDGAMHEVMMEKDDYRNRFWHAFDGYVASYVPAG